MASAEQRARRRAQRATAARLKEARQTHRPVPKILSKAVTEPSRRAAIAQAERWASGEDRPTTKLEKMQAARMASLANNGKAPAHLYDALKQYFYHKEGMKPPESDPADEDYDYDADEDEDESEE